MWSAFSLSIKIKITVLEFVTRICYLLLNDQKNALGSRREVLLQEEMITKSAGSEHMDGTWKIAADCGKKQVMKISCLCPKFCIHAIFFRR